MARHWTMGAAAARVLVVVEESRPLATRPRAGRATLMAAKSPLELMDIVRPTGMFPRSLWPCREVPGSIGLVCPCRAGLLNLESLEIFLSAGTYPCTREEGPPIQQHCALSLVEALPYLVPGQLSQANRDASLAGQSPLSCSAASPCPGAESLSNGRSSDRRCRSHGLCLLSSICLSQLDLVQTSQRLFQQSGKSVTLLKQQA